MHEFHALEHLVRHHQHRLQRETTSALVELIFQRGSQEIHHHEIVRVLRSKVMHLGKARGILQFTVDLVFVAKLRASGTVLFEFYSHLRVVGKIQSQLPGPTQQQQHCQRYRRSGTVWTYLFPISSHTQIDVAEGTSTNSLGDSVFLLTKQRKRNKCGQSFSFTRLRDPRRSGGSNKNLRHPTPRGQESFFP